MTTETTSTTEQAPTFSSSTTNATTQNLIPSWLEIPSKQLVGRANELSQQPYQQYTGERLAGFDPMMLDAFARIQNQGVAGQVGLGTDFAVRAGNESQEAMNYDPYTMGRFTGDAAQQYMSPYMQNVVNTQLREAQREADIATTARQGAATRAGAFGGSRQAIMDAEAARNLSMQKADIQAAGLQKAYEQAQGQFNTEDALLEQSRQFGAGLGLQGASQALGAAQALNQLGQTQFQQEMDITQGRGYAGSLAQQQEQAGLDIAYQDFLAQQKYPYEQMSWLQGILAGAPHSTTQHSTSHTSGVTTPGAQTTHSTSTQTPSSSKPSAASQAAGVATALYGVSQMHDGGMDGYAGGGITSLLSDQQVQQRQQDPELPTIARLAAELEANERAKIRQGAAMGLPHGPRPTVAEEAAAGLAAVPVPEDIAGATPGGVASFADGGGVWSSLAEFFTSSEDDLPDLLAAKERYEAAGADTRGIDQAIHAITSRGAREAARNRDLLNAADAPLRSAQAPNQSPAESARLARQNETAGLLAAAAAEPAPSAPPGSPATNAGQGLPAVAGPAANAGQGLPAVAGPASPGGIAGALPQAQVAPAASDTEAFGQVRQDMHSRLDPLVQEQAKVMQEEADAIAADEAARVARFDERQAKRAESDNPARARIERRERELAQQKKEARAFAIIRAGLAMMSGESPYALVNIARGAQEGLNQYAADTTKIDEAREGLRKELDRLDTLRAEAEAAAGEKREELLKVMEESKRNVRFASRKFLAESKVDADKSLINAFADAAIKQHFGLKERAVEHGYRLEEISAQGRENRRTAAARPPHSTEGRATLEFLKNDYNKAAQAVAALERSPLARTSTGKAQLEQARTQLEQARRAYAQAAGVDVGDVPDADGSGDNAAKPPAGASGGWGNMNVR